MRKDGISWLRGGYFEVMEKKRIEKQAKVLSLQLKRDDMLEVLEKITAEIYTELKSIEYLEQQMGMPDFEQFEQDGLMA